MFCINCGKKLSGNKRKYCSPHCQSSYQSSKKIEDWLSGKWNGANRNGVLNAVVREYLIKEAGHKCPKCGWDKPNPVTGKPILTINHIDGDPSNHSPKNLEVLCYNCHTLTETFGSLNKGSGRFVRGMACITPIGE